MKYINQRFNDILNKGRRREKKPSHISYQLKYDLHLNYPTGFVMTFSSGFIKPFSLVEETRSSFWTTCTKRMCLISSAGNAVTQKRWKQGPCNIKRDPKSQKGPSRDPFGNSGNETHGKSVIFTFRSAFATDDIKWKVMIRENLSCPDIVQTGA